MKKLCEPLRILSAHPDSYRDCEKFFLRLSGEELYPIVASLRQGYTKFIKKCFAQRVLTVTLALTLFSANAQTDSKIQNLIDQGNEIYYSNPDSSYSLCCGAENEAAQTHNTKFTGDIALCKARYLVLVTDYQAAARELSIAIQYFEATANYVKLSKSYSLKSILLDRIGESDESTKVLREAYLISKNHGDRPGEIARLTNLTLDFIEQNQADSAYKYLIILESLGSDIKDESNYFVEQNLGLYYAMIGDDKKAIYYFNRAKLVSEKYEMKDSQATILARLSESYRKLNMLSDAEKSALLSYQISKENTLIFEERDAIEELIFVYEAQEKFDLAFDFRGRLIEIDEQINKLEKVQKLKEEEYKISLAQKEKELAEKELSIQEEKLIASEAKTRSIFFAGIIVVIALILVFTVLIYLRTRKLNRAIELSRIILEQKNREVNDSITYAKQIQDAILSPRKYYETLFKEIFVFYRPKDIVAGDFYWFDKKEDRIFFVAADCTGHGVPGAMVSVICHSALNQSVNEFGLIDPAEILEKASELVLETFAKSDREVKDGMDLAFCVLDTKTNMLHFCGANNPVWIIKPIETDTIKAIPAKQIITSDAKVLVELRGDKRPVGHSQIKKPFTTQKIQLEKGDTLYLSTDGYLDQFGGDKGKKFKSKLFKQKLLQIQNHKLAEQHQMVVSIFDEWKGELEQVDDVCVIAVRIL